MVKAPGGQHSAMAFQAIPPCRRQPHRVRKQCICRCTALRCRRQGRQAKSGGCGGKYQAAVNRGACFNSSKLLLAGLLPLMSCCLLCMFLCSGIQILILLWHAPYKHGGVGLSSI